MVDVTPSSFNNTVQVGSTRTSQEIDIGGLPASAQNAAKARIWAEGTDEEVESLGGERSAKGWAEYVEEISTEGNIGVVADNISNINTVAGISSDVTQVAGISSAVSTVSSHDSEVMLVSDNMASVMTTASNIGNVQTVAGIASDVSTVSGNNSNITSVANNIANINTVAGNTTNINNVASNITNIGTVATNISDVSLVAGDLSNIDTTVANLTAINAAPAAASSASTSATNSQKWAEGSDADVQPLGGTKSSKGWAQVAQYNAEHMVGAKRIGEVFFSESSSAADNVGALPLFTGETISNADQIYPEFYAWVADHTGLQISSADYETAISTYGECPKYVIDTVNKTIRLPKLANYLKMANTTDGIAQAGAGLPNIYTEIATRKYESGVGPVASVTGAGTFENDGYPVASNVYTAENRTSSYALQKSTVDASVGNSIYGNSNTVTPAHTTLFPWVCAYNAAVPASTAQAAQFQAALSSKLDSDFGNSTKPYVTETYVNGTSWYRIWSDGWCEQGGRITGTSITFLQSFVDTNYSFSGVSINSNSGGAASTVTNLTTTGCTYYTYGNAGGMWQACGYIR